MKRPANGLIFPASILAVAIVIAAIVAAMAMASIKRAGDEIAVTGSATRPIRSDLAVWQIEVTGQASGQLAATEESRKGAVKTRAWLAQAGFPDSALTIMAPMTQVQDEWINGNRTGRILGYQVTTQVQVRTPDVDKIADLASDLGPLLDQGVSAVAQQPRYLYAALPSIRGPLLADATRDARARAEEIVEAAGAKVGRIKAVQVGVFQVRQRQSTEVSGYGMYDTGTRDKDVTGVIRVTFAID